jgi:hypothetical protein
MAEQALYGNSMEPAFPFDAVRDQLAWLPRYFTENVSNPAFDLEPLLNTVLVFARARTATLQNAASWNRVRRLVKRLNDVTDSVGASHHKLELVRRGPFYFVTCSRSPRFNWSVHLTHRDVGRNLDMFAPGHCTPEQRYTKRFVHFIEESSMEAIVSEMNLLEYFNDDDMDKFLNFNKTRENLFNSTMEALALEYRFKCIVYFPDVLDGVKSVMESNVPPSSAWWDDHCFYVNGFFFPRVVPSANLAFCGFKTKHDMYWPLVQRTFDFSLQYKRDEYYYTSAETGSAYWKSMETIFGRIKATGEKDISVGDLNVFYAEVEKQLTELATLADSPSKSPNKDRLVRHPSEPRWRGPFIQQFQRVWSELYSTIDVGYMYCFQRWKPKRRLVRIYEVDYPLSGDELACGWPKLPKRPKK